MGYTHFRTITEPDIVADMRIHVLACNIKRAISPAGVQKLIEAIEQVRSS